MRIVIFSHSLISDWNNRNAHFMRGVASELLARGHDVRLYEPSDSCCLSQLLRERGVGAVAAFHDAYPQLSCVLFDAVEPELERLIQGAQLVLVDNWNTRELIGRLGRLRARASDFRLLLHHTPAPSASAVTPEDLQHYDGVLVCANALRERYAKQGFTNVYVWHEAADTRVFMPLPPQEPRRDLVWIGNWGGELCSSQLQSYVLEPSAALQLTADFYGAHYPDAAARQLATFGARYRGALYNFEVARVFASHRATVHVPRAPFSHAQPEPPPIRVFEALACGIPLVCAPWRDEDGLFAPGEDYLIARDAEHMQQQLRAVLHDPALAAERVARGLATIARRHTCAHRVDELLTMHTRITGRPAVNAQVSQLAAMP